MATFVLALVVPLPVAAAATLAGGATAATTGVVSISSPAAPTSGARCPQGTPAPSPTPVASGTKAPLATAVVALPTIAYPAQAVTISSPEVTVKAIVESGGKAGTAFVRFGESAGYLRCSGKVSLAPGSSRVVVSVPLSGLIPKATYHFEVGASTPAGTAYGSPMTFTAPGPPAVSAGVRVGPIELGGATRAIALQRLQTFLAGHLGFTFEDVYWSVPRATLGAQIDAQTTISRALAAPAGTALKLQLTIDTQRLRTYLTRVDARFTHPSALPSIRLVGTRAVVTPARSSVEVDLPRMTSAVRTALDSGLSERLLLLVQPTVTRKAAPVKAVVVRLSSQTLTAYLNGKPVLRTPVTTGRPALPTPVGSYHVLFRASPFVFNSPWPPGSPYWYPPTPVTWAMDFFNGDFLHDDPGEPTSAFGAGSEDGPYASHGCVHVPHDVMAFLYNWLPVGAQVVVSQD